MTPTVGLGPYQSLVRERRQREQKMMHEGSDAPGAVTDEATRLGPARIRPRTSLATGQFNLFTGELEPLAHEAVPTPEETWLFDPDFGLVLPDDPAGKEILVEPGIALQFEPGNRLRGTGNRLQGTGREL